MDLVDIANEICEEKIQTILKSRVKYNTTLEDYKESTKFCSICGIKIPEERLCIIPNACKCVTCQEMQEIKLKQFRA